MGIMRCAGVVLPLAALGLAGCGGGFATPTTLINRGAITVSPASLTVGAGASATFTANLPANLPAGGNLTWSVNPPSGGGFSTAGPAAGGGTGNMTGVFVALANPGTYTINATWTPSLGGSGAILNGSASVAVLPVPQVETGINTGLVQTAGGIQSAGSVQGGAVAGQTTAPTNSTSGNVQNRSGFGLPVCTGTGTGCR